MQTQTEFNLIELLTNIFNKIKLLGDGKNSIHLQKTITQNGSTINNEYSVIFITYASMQSPRIRAEFDLNFPLFSSNFLLILQSPKLKAEFR